MHNRYPTVPESQELATHHNNIHLLSVDWWHVSATCDSSLELAMTVRAVTTDILREQLLDDYQVCIELAAATPNMSLRCVPKHNRRFWPTTTNNRGSVW